MTTRFHKFNEDLTLKGYFYEQARLAPTESMDYPAGKAGVGIKGVWGEGPFPALRYL